LSFGLLKSPPRLLGGAVLLLCSLGAAAPPAALRAQDINQTPVYLTARIFQARARKGSAKDLTDQIFRLPTATLSDDEKWLAAFEKVYPGLQCALLQTHPVRVFKSPKPAIVTIGSAPDRKFELLINAAQSPGDGVTPGLSIIPQVELRFAHRQDDRPLTLGARPFEGEDGNTYFFTLPSLALSAESYAKLLRAGAPAKSFEGDEFHLIFAFSVESSRGDGKFRPFDAKQAAAVQGEATKTPAPLLPAALINSGLGGTVQVRVRVAPDGRVEQASVYSSSFPEANQTVLQTARGWEFPVTLFANSKEPISGLLTFNLAAQAAPQ
jgi:TonB family protein